jgi:hypothetical protein
MHGLSVSCKYKVFSLDSLPENSAESPNADGSRVTDGVINVAQ